MLTFKDLIIKADNSQIEELVDTIISQLSAHSQWQKNENIGENVYTFRRNKDNNLPAVGLSIFQKEDAISWYVPNVVPIDSDQLSCQQYNDILTDFYESLVKSSSEKLNLEVKITSGNVTASDLLGEEAANALSSFSRLANKSTGSADPTDRQRWFCFICEACKSNKHIDVYLLEKLLAEQGWQIDQVKELVNEFEFGKSLVDYVRDSK